MTVKTRSARLPKLTSLDALGRMVQMLLRGRYTVGELAEACGIPSHMGSEHLRLMQRCGFLTSQRDGRKAYYQIVETHLANLMSCIEARFGH
jgi:predicted transcriptional regulator